jgi:hypothetical protein
MIRKILAMTAAACILIASVGAGAMPQAPPDDSRAIEGLWFGSWGGGPAADGVVFQPVMAELFIERDHIEMAGLRNLRRVLGTLRVDSSSKRLQVVPTDKAGGQRPQKAIEYVYRINVDRLTLIDSERFPITFERLSATQNPLANSHVELVTAAGLTAAGDLLVTEYTELRVGRAGRAYFQPSDRTLKTKRALVLLLQEAGWKEISLDDARRLLREPAPVVVAYRSDDQAPLPHWHELWDVLGPPTPESEAVLQTLARMLRPGTLLFVLSARERLPEP